MPRHTRSERTKNVKAGRAPRNPGSAKKVREANLKAAKRAVKKRK